MRNPNASALALWARREIRAWTIADLENRWGPSAVRAAIRGNALARVLPGVLTAFENADSFLARAHAAQLWCAPDSVVIGEGAAAAFHLCDVPKTVTIATGYGVKRASPPWLTLRRLPQPVPSTFWGACPIATPAWAAVTAFGAAPDRYRDRFLYRSVQTGSATVEDLLEAAAAVPRLRGRSHLIKVVAAIAEGSESHLETIGLRRVFNTAQFSDFVRQHWVRTPGGNFRLDMFHAASRTAVELDGAGDHTKPERRQYDINRDVNAARTGILTLRFSARDLSDHPTRCRASVADVVASRL